MSFLRILYFYTLVCLLFIWVGLSITRVFYNIVRTVTTEREWFLMTDDEKRANLLGNEHIFLAMTKKTTPSDAEILVLIPNANILPGLFYKTIYYLYPRKLTFVEYINSVNLKDFEFIISCSNDSILLDVTFENVSNLYEYEVNNVLCTLYRNE